VRGVAYAYAALDGEERRYGRLDDEAPQQFAEDLATWLANGRRFPREVVETEAGASFTLRDLVNGYAAFTVGEYGPEWHENNEARVRLALASVLDLYGDVPAVEFGPLKLKAVREHLVSLKRDDRITPQLSVTTINERMRIIRTAFAWAVSDELVRASVLEGLNAVKTLRQGKPGTRGERKVLPVHRAAGDFRVVKPSWG
jgi:hypothetical protein